MKFRAISAAAIAVVLVACSSKSVKNVPVEWKGSMQELAGVLNDLYPYVYSDKAYNDPVNYSIIETDTEHLAQIAHRVKELHEQGKMAAADSDPSMKLVVGSFDKEMTTALDGLRSNKRDYSRAVLKNATGLCMQCHTRGTFGPEYVSWHSPEQMPNLTRFERAELLAATRRYDQSLELYQSILSDPVQVKTNPFEWDSAARAALNIAIRVHQSPDEALAVTNTVLTAKEAPISLRNRAMDWRKYILSWQAARKKAVSDPIAEAKKIMKNAAGSALIEDRGNLAAYLRASALLHDYIRTAATSDSAKRVAEAYYLLGQCYEVIQEQRFWNLNELYYKACIFKAPHTPIAQQCYEQYEDAMFVGALKNGSGPTGLSSVTDYMDYLRGLATP